MRERFAAFHLNCGRRQRLLKAGSSSLRSQIQRRRSKCVEKCSFHERYLSESTPSAKNKMSHASQTRVTPQLGLSGSLIRELSVAASSKCLPMICWLENESLFRRIGRL